MSLQVSSLNSGSNGNCYYIGNQTDAILVDAGISCREIERRLNRLELSVSRIRAVFITHEHADHIHGLKTLCKRHRLPVYITEGTLRSSRLSLNERLITRFTPLQPVTVGSLTVTGFSKRHDAADPHSFIVDDGHLCVGVFTDIGNICENVILHFRRCHAAFLESNYDEEMLDKGTYPYALKTRIRGGFGHLSNRQALRLFRDHKPAFMSHLFLSHLSQENNTPELAAQLFTRFAGKTNIIVASRHEETSLYEITGQLHDLSNSVYSKRVARQAQLTLGF